MSSSKHHQIVIAGGGNAGISIAAQLLRKNSKLDIAIVDPSDKHYYQPAWTLVGGGDFDVNATVRSQASVIPKGAKWVKQAVTGFDPDNNAVKLDNGEQLTYDYLVVTLGIKILWDQIEGLKETIGKNGVTSNYSFQYAPYTYECIKSIQAGQTALFTQPDTPIKCGGAPQKIMYLAADNFRKRGILDKVNVEFFKPGVGMFSVKKYNESLTKMVQKYGIKTNWDYVLVKVDGPNKTATFRKADGSTEDRSFDMIHVTPPQGAPDAVKNSPLANEGGWVDVDAATTQHKKYANVFSAGDSSGLPISKTGAAIRKQAPVLVANLLAAMEGKSAPAKYTGYTSCPLVVGYGKLILAEFDYNGNPMETFPFDQGKPRWTMYLLKKKVLPWLYWNKILKGTA